MVSKRARDRAEYKLGWIRNLFEVGKPLTTRIDRYAEKYERMLSLRAQVKAMGKEIERFEQETRLMVGRNWTASQIWAAEQGDTLDSPH